MSKFNIKLDVSYDEKDMIRHADKIDWTYLSNNLHLENLSNGFIHRFKDKIQWNVSSHKFIFSEKFVDEFADVLDWEGVSQTCAFSQYILEKNKDKVVWYMLDCNVKVSKQTKAFFSKEIIKSFMDLGDKEGSDEDIMDDLEGYISEVLT